MLTKTDVETASKALSKLPMCQEYIILSAFLDKVKNSIPVKPPVAALLRNYNE